MLSHNFSISSVSCVYKQMMQYWFAESLYMDRLGYGEQSMWERIWLPVRGSPLKSFFVHILYFYSFGLKKKDLRETVLFQRFMFTWQTKIPCPFHPYCFLKRLQEKMVFNQIHEITFYVTFYRHLNFSRQATTNIMYD